MDGPTDEEGPAAVAREIQQQPARRRVCRRLVQSTLFPHKSPEVESSNGEEGNGQDDEEEYCGSQGNKKRTRKTKSTPTHSKAPRKAKEKSSANATLKKNATPRKSVTLKKNAPSNGKIGVNSVENEGGSPPIPNLRLEAKITAEENSRIFAGKQIHAFFSSWKVGKRHRDPIEADNNGCMAQRIDNSVTIGPIHVFAKEEDDVVPMDWRNWKFCEKSFANSSYSLESPSSNIDGYINHAGVSCSSSMSLDESASLNQCHFHQELVPDVSAIVSAMSFNGEAACCQIVKDEETQTDYEVVGAFSGFMRKSNVEQSELVLKRSFSYHLDCAKQLDDRLWTDKFQPKEAREVCGNHESVRFLSEWLHTWRHKGHQASKDSCDGDEHDMQDDDSDYVQSDSDLENLNESAHLKNVLLITGPVGSGKSAAIYACAKEHGFKVLEANSSDCRNGAVMKQRFGDALNTHSLDWSQENTVESVKFFTSLSNSKMAQEFDNEVIEVEPIPDEDNSCGDTEAAEKFVCKGSSTGHVQGQLKTLILFEDVDITFPEDRGFISAIQQIAEKAKGPVILTSNCNNHVLPDNLDRLEVCFTIPSEQELLKHAYMICSNEQADIEPHLVEELIEYCGGDIRKMIMHLQFWCQGKILRKGTEAHLLSGPQLFDPVSGHQILPKMIPWAFPSQLSEIVEKEIRMSLSKMEEDFVSMDITEEYDKQMLSNIEMHSNETDSAEAKKQAMWRNCSDHDCNDLTDPIDVACDFFNSLDTPISLSQRKRRRKCTVVMSSDSEDELPDNKFPLTSDKEANNGLFGVDSAFMSHFPGKQNFPRPSPDMKFYSEAGKLKGSCNPCAETAVDLHVKDTCNSVDMSCVPESSFVPETAVNNGMEECGGRVSCGQETDALEEVSVSNEFKEDFLRVEDDNYDKSMPELHNDAELLPSTFGVTAESFQEEVEDSQNDHVKAVTREYQVMDECSCMDFRRKLKPGGRFRSCAVTDVVRESWRKLRTCHADLRRYVTSEHKDASQIIELASGASNLISEAEILVSKCQQLDFLDLQIFLSEASDALNWCDEQLRMTSTMVWHGFCFYAKEIAALGLEMGSESAVDSNWKIFSTRMTDIGTKMNLPQRETLSNSETKSCLFDTVQSVVPPQSYMTMKDYAFYEYLSFLSYISRSEASRLSEAKTKRRRAGSAQNCLSSVALTLSPERISLLGKSNIFGSQLADTNIK